MKFLEKKPVRETRFSDFIRNARSDEKKKVYAGVLKKATENQLIVLEKAKESRKASHPCS